MSNNAKYYNNSKPQISKDFYNPYTFIPLASKPLLLNIEEKKLLENIHDLPIKNGVSGVIDVDFIVKSPICIKQNNSESLNIRGKYFIPGSSLKGMIRNVFEIITLSNIKNAIANNRYSLRDIRSDDYILKSNDKEQTSGFLIKIKDKFFVMPCRSDKYSYSEIKGIEGVDVKTEKGIREKYAKVDNDYIFQDGESDQWKFWFFSGFMNNKQNEYLFDIPEIISANNLIPLVGEAYEDFIFIHEKENENLNWKFWKKRLKNYETIEDIEKDKYRGMVPCFFRTKVEESKKYVRDLGFSFLYRQPYHKKIHDFLPETYKKDTEIDLTHAVFGYTNNSGNLKGRVHFSNAFIGNVNLIPKQSFIFGKPKPTYYPFYLVQKTGKKLKTYFSNDTQISGWKRYIGHDTNKIGISTGKAKVESVFIPIGENASFNLKLRFHNLHQYELGALLLALTLNNNECYHFLGYAKSQGYGKIKLDDIKLSVDGEQQVLQSYINKYFEYLKMKLDGNLAEFETIFNKLKNLSLVKYHENKEIRYPKLNAKEFEQIKNNNFNITDFSPDL